MRTRGILSFVDLDGRHGEIETRTCSHCNRCIVLTGPIEEMGGGCRICNGFICQRCVNLGRNGRTCDVHEEKMRRAEARYMFRRDAGLTS